ncbi:MAG: HU family DNA-binding protein [Bacteroidales bacterium]|nr:HU family DNA-binding protein [Bacteroidales bacterium]
MTKKDFADKMAEKTGLTKVDSLKAYDAFLEVASDYLKKGEKVALLGFGTFSLQHKDARTARNPRDGKSIKVAAKTVVKFKPGKVLSDSVVKVKVKK